MPPLIVTAGCQFKMYWDVEGITVLNVFGGRATGTGTVTSVSAQAVADVVSGAFASAGLAGLMGDGVHLLRVGQRDVRTANQAEFFGTATGDGTDGGGQIMPRSNGVVVTLRTALSGKFFRGRSYMTGFTEPQNIDGALISPSVITACEGFWDAIRTNLTATGWNLSILSPALPARPNHDGSAELPAWPGANTPVISVEVRNSIWGSQRRRNHRP
jgi:hypothetical protein